MKSTLKVATSLMAVAMMTVPMMALAQSSQMGNAPMQSSTNSDWTTAPTGMAADGYKDGIEAAKLDRLVKRPMDAKLGAMYKNPPVNKAQKDAYRAAFVAGYQAAVQHAAGTTSGN